MAVDLAGGVGAMIAQTTQRAAPGPGRLVFVPSGSTLAQVVAPAELAAG